MNESDTSGNKKGIKVQKHKLRTMKKDGHVRIAPLKINVKFVTDSLIQYPQMIFSKIFATDSFYSMQSYEMYKNHY